LVIGKRAKGRKCNNNHKSPLNAKRASSACKMIDSVSAKLLEYIGDADQFDDITMLAIQRS